MCKIEKEFDEFLNIINNNKDIGIVMHNNPDGDSIASMFFLENMLKALNKNLNIDFIIHNKIPENFSFWFYKYVNRIIIPQKKYDVLIVLDSPSKQKTYYDIDNIAKIIINIDHHKNNKKFGDLNIVEFSPSTGYLLYKMAIYFNVSISKQMAEYLFISLAWDTNYFSNNFTNAECFTIASHLISLGAIPSRVYNNLFCYKKRNDLEIQKYLINNIKTYNDIYYITVPYDLQIDSIDVFNFISYINNLSNIRYFILFIQIDDTHYEIKTNNNSNLFNYLKSKYEELYKIKISKSFEQDILKVLKDFDNYLKSK